MKQNLEQQLIGLKKKLRRSINRQKILIASKVKLKELNLELQKSEEKLQQLEETLVGKTIEANKLVQSSKEVINNKFIMQ
jgi:hypothetical protein